MVEIQVDVVGTGWPMDRDFFMTHEYIDTINDGPNVWHMFQRDTVFTPMEA